MDDQTTMKCVDMYLRKTTESLRTDWLCSHDCLERFVERQRVRELCARILITRHFAPPPALVHEAIQKSFASLRKTVQEKLKHGLEEKNLDLDEYEEIRDEFRDMERRRQTVRRHSARRWRNVPSRLFGAAATAAVERRETTKRDSSSNMSINNKLAHHHHHPQVTSWSNKQRNSSIWTSLKQTRSSSTTNGGEMVSAAALYESVKKEIWEREARDLSASLERDLQAFVLERSERVREEIEKLDVFENMLRY